MIFGFQFRANLRSTGANRCQVSFNRFPASTPYLGGGDRNKTTNNNQQQPSSRSSRAQPGRKIRTFIELSVRQSIRHCHTRAITSDFARSGLIIYVYAHFAVRRPHSRGVMRPNNSDTKTVPIANNVVNLYSLRANSSSSTPPARPGRQPTHLSLALVASSTHFEAH